jgi:hypothetical protein
MYTQPYLLITAAETLHLVFHSPPRHSFVLSNINRCIEYMFNRMDAITLLLSVTADLNVRVASPSNNSLPPTVQMLDVDAIGETDRG